jgi:hypothetical protein
VKVVSDFESPWAMTFLPDGRMLITEKSGIPAEEANPHLGGHWAEFFTTTGAWRLPRHHERTTLGSQGFSHRALHT